MAPAIDATERPFFVVGALRSGTTLLRLMLDAHPEICNFGEFEYAVRYARRDRFPPLGSYRQLLEADRVFRAHHFEMGPHATYPALVKSFVRQASCRSGKPIVGATIHSRFDLLPTLWPNARYLHLVRDPRDVSRSCIGMGWVGNVWYGADVWLDAESRWQGMAQTLSDEAIVEIRFEDLVSDPRRELGKVCQFLALDYAEDMLSYPDHTTYATPDPSLANQWRRKMSDAQVRLVEQKCAGLMEKRGYQRVSSGGPVRWFERTPLSIENRARKLQFNVRRYGLQLYLQSRIADRLGVTRSAWARRVLRRVDEVTEACLK